MISIFSDATIRRIPHYTGGLYGVGSQQQLESSVSLLSYFGADHILILVYPCPWARLKLKMLPSVEQRDAIKFFMELGNSAMVTLNMTRKVFRSERLLF